MMRLFLCYFCFFALFSFSAQADELPIQKVVISNAGLIHFHHTGVIEGNKTLNLVVPLEQVNDILKSLVVMDTEGAIESVTLAGKEPLEEQLKPYSFSSYDINTPLALIQSLQGSTVDIESKDNEVEGVLVNAVQQTETDKNGNILTKIMVMVMDKDGDLQRFDLNTVTAIEIEEDRLQENLEKALGLIKEQKMHSTRTIQINLLGNNKRNVSYSYVVRAPLWKTAYRLVMPTNDEKEGLLQGWGILENMSGQDWQDVELILTSGASVAYQQSLYESYYKQRPYLPLDVMGTIQPRKDTGELSATTTLSQTLDRQERYSQESPIVQRSLKATQETLMGAPTLASGLEPTQIQQQTTDVHFILPQKITLKAGQSMMVPFINEKLPLDNLYVYQPQTNNAHPLAAASIVNKSSYSLPPGIVTLYKNDVYLGDSQVALLPPKEKRLLPYALDMKTTIDYRTQTDRKEISLTNTGNVLKALSKTIAHHDYTIRSVDTEDKTIVLELPKRTGWDLSVTPQIQTTETTTHYRLYVPLKKGESKKINARLSHINEHVLTLQSLTPKRLEQLALVNPDPKSKELFEDLAKIQNEITLLQQKITRLKQQQNSIIQDQVRLRDNLKSVGNKTDLGKKYLDKLSDQETQLDNIEQQKQVIKKEIDKLSSFMNIRLFAVELK